MPVVSSCENAVTVLTAWLYLHGKIVRVLESSRLLPFWRLLQTIIFIRGYAATSVTRVLTQTRAAHTGSQELNEAPCSSVLCGPPYTGPAHSAAHSQDPSRRLSDRTAVIVILPLKPGPVEGHGFTHPDLRPRRQHPHVESKHPCASLLARRANFQWVQTQQTTVAGWGPENLNFEDPRRF